VCVWPDIISRGVQVSSVLPIIEGNLPPRPPTISVKQMLEVDRIMMEDLQVTRYQMMENAGRLLAVIAGSTCGGLAGRRFLIMAGSGGNGGGGLIAARYIANWGGIPEVLVSKTSEITRPLLHTLEQLDIKIHDDPATVERDYLTGIIDALLGIGANGAPRGQIATWIRWANEAKGMQPPDLSLDQEHDDPLPIPILALDVPSGLDPDTGETNDPCIRALNTLTVGLPKPGLYANPAACGFLYLGDIGVPPPVFHQVGVAAPLLFIQHDFIHIS